LKQVLDSRFLVEYYYSQDPIIRQKVNQKIKELTKNSSGIIPTIVVCETIQLICSREGKQKAEMIYQSRFVGRSVDVLWERAFRIDDQEFQLSGLTGNYMRVIAIHGAPLTNQISRVKIQSREMLSLVGSISENCSPTT